jgi:hypothetical protein
VRASWREDYNHGPTSAAATAGGHPRCQHLLAWLEVSKSDALIRVHFGDRGRGQVHAIDVSWMGGRENLGSRADDWAGDDRFADGFIAAAHTLHDRTSEPHRPLLERG